MDRFDGTAARQLDWIQEIEDAEPSVGRNRLAGRPQPRLRLLRRDVYAELERRRRRAQIRARHLIDQ